MPFNICGAPNILIYAERKSFYYMRSAKYFNIYGKGRQGLYNMRKSWPATSYYKSFPVLDLHGAACTSKHAQRPTYRKVLLPY